MISAGPAWREFGERVDPCRRASHPARRGLSCSAHGPSSTGCSAAGMPQDGLDSAGYSPILPPGRLNLSLAGSRAMRHCSFDSRRLSSMLGR